MSFRWLDGHVVGIEWRYIVAAVLTAWVAYALVGLFELDLRPAIRRR